MNDKKDLHLEEGEKEILIDHVYDGIQELNNPLPSWWSFTFYAGIVFAVIYFPYFMFAAPTHRQEFTRDHAGIIDLQNQYNKNNGSFDVEQFQAIFIADGAKAGKTIFENNCVACHKDNGAGDIGPNLSDEYWLYAKGNPETIYPVVFNGVPDNGMPNWNETLTKDEIYQVVAYVQTLRNTHQRGGKAPQGNKVE